MVSKMSSKAARLLESDKRSDRPKLAKALAHAKAIGATVVFAKLDRLTRNVDLLRSLVASDVDLVFCDLPHVPTGAMGRFLLTQMASVAELEAGLISERTKAALAAAKARGVKLGGVRANQHKLDPAMGTAGRGDYAWRRLDCGGGAERVAAGDGVMARRCRRSGSCCVARRSLLRDWATEATEPAWAAELRRAAATIGRAVERLAQEQATDGSRKS